MDRVSERKQERRGNNATDDDDGATRGGGQRDRRDLSHPLTLSVAIFIHSSNLPVMTSMLSCGCWSCSAPIAVPVMALRRRFLSPCWTRLSAAEDTPAGELLPLLPLALTSGATKWADCRRREAFSAWSLLMICEGRVVPLFGTGEPGAALGCFPRGRAGGEVGGSASSSEESSEEERTTAAFRALAWGAMAVRVGR